MIWACSTWVGLGLDVFVDRKGDDSPLKSVFKVNVFVLYEKSCLHTC